ncbi:MAG: coenzyme F420-0:L-glutamate ligase, partial [Oscillospiraceae bacterium]
MERNVGTSSRGVRAPIIRQGDNLSQIVVDSVVAASKSDGFAFEDRDIVGITEAVVARAQGNYATIDNIADDIKTKFGDSAVGVIFPILSRNRFAICLKGIAKGLKKMVLMFSYPSDEVGNHLIDVDILDEKGVNPYTDVLTEKKYRELFGTVLHPFTGVDYVDYYKNLVLEQGCEVEIVFSNNPRTILDYTKKVVNCDIHTRKRTRRILENSGAEKIVGLDEILTSSVDGSGYNENYGLLGSNKSTEDSVKLFPRDCQAFVDDVANKFKEATGKNIEVLIYGDGAFKDPVGKIWELADPVVSPAYTKGLEGTPNELKLKYLADNNFADLSGDALKKAISEYIKQKDDNLVGKMESQ